VVAVLRVARVLVILLLASLVISLVMGIGTASTGVFEKAVLLALIAGCVYVSAKVTDVTEWAVRRLESR
jgi:hypothetical protein